MEKKLMIEGARVVFRNFAGKEGMYNREGDRSFCILLDEDLAEQMAKDGWNIKTLRAREEGEPEQPYIQVAVNFKGRPPRVVLITSRGRTNLNEDEVEVLDWVDIANVDLIINPYEWAVNGKTGVKAYLNSFYITISEDPLELKYNEVPEVGVIEMQKPLAIEELPTRSGRLDDIHDAELVED